MSAQKANDERELDRLIDRMCDQIASVDELAALGRRLVEVPSARDYYIACLELHARLAWQMTPGKPFSLEELLRYANDELAERGDEDSGFGVRDTEKRGPESRVPSPEPRVPPIVLDLSTTSHYPLTTIHSFVGSWAFSYLIATLLVGTALLGAWAYKITHYQQIAEAPTAPASNRPELVFVGRITGMKDCRWSDPQTEAYAGASVPLGRKYALASGLMQITYDSGAKVILEGPCTYEVESRAGGYLALGKLTARVASGQWPVASAEPQAANLQISKSPNPKAPGPWPLTPDPFCVRTPTAVVTDLGTEFGVEVSKEGNTTSHVFRGSVKVQVVSSEKGTGPICRNGPEGASHKLDLSPFPAVVLRASESARVEKDEEAGVPRLVTGGKTGHPPKFVRRLVEPPKVLDLLDIVAGGNGTGNRCERGIDPATGKQDTWFLSDERKDDHGYHRATWHPLIDGVFIPHVPTTLTPTPPTVQLDSAGNTFAGFTDPRIIDGKNRYCTIQGHPVGSIWSRAADVNSAGAMNRNGWIYSIDRSEEYMPEGRGLLGIHANAGITFDLAAMRKMHKDVRPARFRATAGMGDGPRKYPDAFGMADLWIFVDGRLKWNRKDIRHQDGAIEVDVSLGPRDRFLTIVSTNGQRGKAYDWLVLGDPALETAPIESETPADEKPEEVTPELPKK